MAYRYSEFGYEGCSCIEPEPDFCTECGSECNKDGELCDFHFDMKVKADAEEKMMQTLVQLDDLGNFITNL